MVARGEVYWLELEQEGRRPVVVLTRDEALAGLRNVIVALVTRTVPGIETEVEIGPTDGGRWSVRRRPSKMRRSF